MRSASVGFRRNSRASPRTVPLSDGSAPCPCSASSARSRVACSPSSTPPLAGPLRPSAIAITTPCSVCMSCLVGSIREKMLRRLTSMVSRFSAGRRNSTLSSSRTRLSKNACIWCCEARSERSGIANGSAPVGRQLEPFIADQQHRLRQVERGKAGIDRKGDDAVGAAPPPRSASRSARGRTGCRPCRRPRCRPRSRARRPPGATTGLAWSWARAVVANNSVQSATACSTVSNSSARVQDMVGAGGGALGGDVRPAVARIDDPQAASARNCPSRARPCRYSRRAAARPESRRGRRDRRLFGLVGARTGHLTSLSDSSLKTLNQALERN